MLIVAKDGSAIASGKAVKNGSALNYFGAKQTPKYTVSVLVSNDKDKNGEWSSKFIECEVIGNYAMSLPDIPGGAMVFASGKMQRRSWTGRDGEERTAESLRCDFIMSPSAATPPPVRHPSAQTPAPGTQADFAELDGDDGTLPF